MEREQCAVALHACGDLHLRLLDLVQQRRTRQLALSPCCYHLISRLPYEPRSEAGRRNDPTLDREALRLALQETVTAGRGTRQRRRRESAWRLGFDQLQRELRGEDRYLPVPPLPAGLMKGSFEAFCRVAAEKRSLALPAGIDFERFEAAGSRRLAEVRRLALLRSAFRRAIEVWLVCDYAQALVEDGFRVRLGRFCPRRVTPRNLMLLAEAD